MNIEESKQHEIVICMGSACFSHGNKLNLEIIKNYIKNNGLEASVEFKGALCTNRCMAAPVITIDGETYENTVPQAVTELLDRIFKK